MHNWTIYMYTFPNDKKYIGATKKPLHRRQGSYESNWGGYRNCKLLWKAIQQFGVDSVKQTILFQGKISDKEAAELERYYIALYKTNANQYKNPSFGYNLGIGGEGIGERHLSKEWIDTLIQRMKRQGSLNRGKTASAETRSRQRMAKLGTKRGPCPKKRKEKLDQLIALK